MNFKNNTIALAVGSAVCLSNSVWAAEPSTTLEIAPITVTGEKINRTLEQTQSSVVVVTDKQLREKEDHSLIDVFARTPGVYNQSGNENWGIRGVPVSGFDDQGPATLNGAVSVFVDGAVQPNRALTLSPMPLWDVEQVEVFLGPQSTTQGRNSLAGAVVIQTKNPTFEPSFSAQTNVGNYNERGGAVAGGGSIVDDKMPAVLPWTIRKVTATSTTSSPAMTPIRLALPMPVANC